MTKYYTTTDSRVNIGFDDVMIFDSIDSASEYGSVQAIKPLDRWDFGAKFTFTVYDHNGELINVFDCHLDADDGGWVCADRKLFHADFVYGAIAEQAACDFREVGKQTGIYETPNFECDCDAVGSEYAWIVSAV
jgi:hypothetical protein